MNCLALQILALKLPFHPPDAREHAFSMIRKDCEAPMLSIEVQPNRFSERDHQTEQRKITVL
jgi:hypothetical protein